MANFKSEFDKLGIDEFENGPTSLISLKSKGDELYIDKLKPVPVDFKKIK